MKSCGNTRSVCDERAKRCTGHGIACLNNPQVARVLVNRVRLERTCQFCAGFLGWELWKGLKLDRFFEQAVDNDPADVPWPRADGQPAVHARQ
jgi:hypothetical protein